MAHLHHPEPAAERPDSRGPRQSDQALQQLRPNTKHQPIAGRPGVADARLSQK